MGEKKEKKEGKKNEYKENANSHLTLKKFVIL